MPGTGSPTTVRLARSLLTGVGMRSTALLLATLSTALLACTDGEVCDADGHCDEDETGLFEQAYEEGQEEGKADGTDCSGVRVPDRTNFNKRIALTFDDGPNPATTPQVMAILRRHNAKAAFFINGSKLGVAGATDLAREIAADPQFILANHSHRHQNLATLEASVVATEIDRTDALIKSAGEIPRFFRFPFGSSNCGTMGQVRTRGYISTGWHIDSADWCFAAGGGVCKPSTFKYVPDEYRSSMLDYVMSQVRSTNGGILLFHDIHPSTANALDGILTALEAAGYTFVGIDDAATFPRLNGAAPAPTKFVGSACTTSADCAFTAAGQAGRCHPAGFCTVSCEGSCPDASGFASTFCIADTAATAVSPGICASKAASQNQLCAALPRTIRTEVPRFIGTSTAAPAVASVCAPS